MTDSSEPFTKASVLRTINKNVLSCSVTRDLKQRRRRHQRERRKSNRFRSAKQQLCTCITRFCTFLCRHCTTTTRTFPISRFMKDVNPRKRFSFFFGELTYSPLEFNSWIKKIATIWKIKRVGIRTMKFQTARIHFLSDVFSAAAAAVAVG